MINFHLITKHPDFYGGVASWNLSISNSGWGVYGCAEDDLGEINADCSARLEALDACDAPEGIARVMFGAEALACQNEEST